MQYSILAIAFAALAAASPMSSLESRQAGICPGIDSPQCCQTSVEGVVDLECSTPPNDPATAADVRSECAATGLTAKCCTLPVAGLGVVCNDL
ncbi:hypothetical protein KC343_g8716 [Hortaea werneckii]|nr:hypothetical protein KC352_g22244 [Hortaea werneckii]KAI7271845.1 hypothetical protein KC345_g7188 [Hortaea werneckii]KAI7563375.1 hypothetical protein KC317_g7774 [Hortaea werneckii]KAI7602477.1 hypothetical protein KC346_g12349 [Hortaea werneckii]KAI7619458.1 hypothetical protein KC343_g8716 [Hortaea werneckii]